MVQDFKKVKEVFRKTFCFMQWQVDAARKRGEDVMEKEYIKFLLQLDGLAENDVYHFHI